MPDKTVSLSEDILPARTRLHDDVSWPLEMKKDIVGGEAMAATSAQEMQRFEAELVNKAATPRPM